jgi:mTERF
MLDHYLFMESPEFDSLDGVEVRANAAAIQVSIGGGRIGANLGYFYLQKELKLSEHHMVKIMEKYPWIMYLKVDTNLRPTVEVLKSFGFRDKDVRTILEKVPPILGINHEWTLPEKLISLQKMFNLNRAGLVKLVVHQPFLLTCSIDRNIRVSEFLSETVGLSPESIRNCLLCCPEVAMSGITKMAACWSVLTDIYGLSDKQARALVVQYPIVLTHRTLKTIQDKVSFFSEELNMSPPFREVQKIIMRYPQLLCIDPNVFMRPNVALLKEYLELDREGIAKLISFFPSALGYNPKTLERAIRKSLFMLTGLEEYSSARGSGGEELGDDDDEDDLGIFEGEVQDVSNLALGDLRRGPLSLDLQSIELAASNILDVKDGDILSLHILPASLNPFSSRQGREGGVVEPHIIISSTGHEGRSRIQVKTDTHILADDGIQAALSINQDENEYEDGDDEDNDDYNYFDGSDDLFGYETGEYESGNEKKGRAQKESDSKSSSSGSGNLSQSVGVDVIAEAVARIRAKVDGKPSVSGFSIADVISTALSSNIPPPIPALTPALTPVPVPVTDPVPIPVLGPNSVPALVPVPDPIPAFVPGPFMGDELTLMAVDVAVQSEREVDIADSMNDVTHSFESTWTTATSTAAAAVTSTATSTATSTSTSTSTSTTHTVAAHAANEIEAMRLMMLLYSTLSIDKARALCVVKSAPWVLSYRPERSQRTLSTIGFSLGMSRTELSRLVRSYPRVLSLSVDGKISEVLTALANAAAESLLLENTEEYLIRASLFKVRKSAPKTADDLEIDSESELVTDLLDLAGVYTESTGKTHDEWLDNKAGDGVISRDPVKSKADENEASVAVVACCSIALARRRDIVRTMVRTAVLKWPLLLGTSMGKINAGLDEVRALQVPFGQLIQIVRRSPKTQLKWKTKVLDLVIAAKIKQEMKVKRAAEKKCRDELSSRTYYEHEIDSSDDLEESHMDSEADMEVLIVKEEEKKKAKLEKKKKKAEFIKKIRKVLKPIFKNVSGSRSSPLSTAEDAVIIDVEVGKKLKKKKEKENPSNSVKKGKTVPKTLL